MSVTSAILHQVSVLGYTVSYEANERAVVMQAIPKDGGETKTIRHECAEGEDAVYLAAYQLAELVGIELEDG